jgi:hypothetical protein
MICVINIFFCSYLMLSNYFSKLNIHYIMANINKKYIKFAIRINNFDQKN